MNYEPRTMNHEPFTSIENPTLAHFRHFSSLFTYSPLYICRESSTNQLFLCKTNPILSAIGGFQMNLKFCNKMAYENISDWTLGENKPNQTQFKPKTNPICEMTKMNLSYYSTKDYENKRLCRQRQNKPNQTQFQTQFQRTLSALKACPEPRRREWQKNKADMVAQRRHEYQLQVLRTGFIRRFFSLTIRFFNHLRVKFGFDYLFGPSCLYELLRPYLDRPVHKFRDIIDDHTRLVIFRVFLRQQERLAEIAVGIEIAEIRMGAYSILTFTAKDNPTAVAGPAMITFRPVAV